MPNDRTVPVGTPVDHAIEVAGRAIAGPNDYMEDWQEFDGTARAAVAAFLRSMHEAADGAHVDLPGVTVYTGEWGALADLIEREADDA